MDDSYFLDHVPIWEGGGKSYEVLSDPTSGRIPVTRIEDWRDLDELVRTGFYSQRKMIFRGQRRHDWALDPTLARIPSNGVISRELADRQLAAFKLAVRGRLSDYELVKDGYEYELWSVGQHHGLLTPLLDWTHSPYVALFFAFFKEDPEEENDNPNPYRVVYVLDKEFVADDELCPNVRLVEPKRDDHGRLVNQAGLFTFSPYDSTIEAELANALSSEQMADEDLRSASEDEQAGLLAKYLCKIYIRNEARDECLQHLRRMNVHHASLFPDLLGASEHCNLIVAEQQKEYEIQTVADELARRLERLDEAEEDSVEMQKYLGLKTAAETDQFEQVLLDGLGAQEFDAARLQLISQHLNDAIERNQVVDWHERESALARIRNALRAVLRKYGYPQEAREQVVQSIEQLVLEHAADLSSNIIT